MSTLAETIQLAIDTAIAGSDPDTNPLAKQTLEAESLIEQCLHELGEAVSNNQWLRSRLVKSYSITLTNGVGTLSSGLLVQHLGEGLVRDGDTGVNNGLGNILQRILHLADFYGDLPAWFGYYHTTQNDQILTRQVNTGSLDATLTPLTIVAPFTPTKSELNTLVDAEIHDQLVEILAARLRGQLEALPGTSST